MQTLFNSQNFQKSITNQIKFYNNEIMRNLTHIIDAIIKRVNTWLKQKQQILRIKLTKHESKQTRDKSQLNILIQKIDKFEIVRNVVFESYIRNTIRILMKKMKNFTFSQKRQMIHFVNQQNVKQIRVRRKLKIIIKKFSNLRFLVQSLRHDAKVEKKRARYFLNDYVFHTTFNSIVKRFDIEKNNFEKIAQFEMKLLDVSKYRIIEL